MPVITFSRYFPVNHPRKGEPTYFAEQILKGLSIPDYWKWFDEANNNCGADHHEFIRTFNYTEFNVKSHTIRAGNRWKVGDKFSPRIWSGRPYNSKQIQIAPDIEIKKIWDITKAPHKDHGFAFHLDGDHYVADWEIDTANIMLEDLARNDGLSKEDFVNWFPKNFIGQILCWNENINY